MIKKIAADIIYDGRGGKFTDHVLVVNEGRVESIDVLADHDPATVEFYEGLLLPGLINTHCHLELSHMKGMVDTGTGLLPFIGQVVQFRDIPQEKIDEAIVKGDEEMQKEGIVAVGDISNKMDTALIKDQSPIRYYTFVEMFDFLQDSMTASTIAQYKEVYDGQSGRGGNEKAFVPHAPYSVSPGLFKFIKASNPSPVTVSIHNEETQHENDLFLKGEGGFIDWYKGFGFSLDHFKATGKTSIHYALENLDPKNRNLFVHNTMMSLQDIKAAQKWSDQVYWATCANANLYIENRLPNYALFQEAGAKMTIGTDSLTSNWQLSVWEEIKTIRKYASYVSLDDLVSWACYNGACALGFDEDLGSFEKGKTPGINLVACRVDDGGADIENSSIQKLL